MPDKPIEEAAVDQNATSLDPQTDLSRFVQGQLGELRIGKNRQRRGQIRNISLERKWGLVFLVITFEWMAWAPTCTTDNPVWKAEVMNSYELNITSYVTRRIGDRISLYDLQRNVELILYPQGDGATLDLCDVQRA